VPIIHVDLHGNAPDKSGAALLLIDFINDLEFEEGEAILEVALPAARKVLALKQRARDSKIPVIYVNDNFGRWRSDFAAQVRHCLEDNVRGRPIPSCCSRMRKTILSSNPSTLAFIQPAWKCCSRTCRSVDSF